MTGFFFLAQKGMECYTCKGQNQGTGEIYVKEILSRRIFRICL